MMSLYKFLNVFAVAMTFLLVEQTLAQADSCECDDLDVCEGFEAADVVLHGTVVSRRGGRRRSRRNSSITYTVELTTLYKGNPDVSDSQEVTFTTERSSPACGVFLEVGEEYLLSLYLSDEDLLTANSCGLAEEWNSVPDEDKASVEAACEEDPCDVDCTEFQECLLYGTDQYYCADVCDPSPCEDDEVCSIEQIIVCIRDPCPPSAVCTASSV